MKELSQEEFTDRIGALERAKRIFPDVVNIPERFRLYQEVFAEREREIFVTTQMYGNRPRTIMDRYDRPKCTECGADMAFRQVPENKEGIKVQLVCMNEKCDTVLNSDNDIMWWMKQLKVKESETADGLDATFKGTGKIQQDGGHSRDRRRLPG
jgi:hypothetical protein